MFCVSTLVGVYVCVTCPLLFVFAVAVFPLMFSVTCWFDSLLLSASVSVTVMLIGVLLIGVLLDTFRSILVFIFLTVMLVVALLLTY